jgi:hypothetical protein
LPKLGSNRNGTPLQDANQLHPRFGKRGYILHAAWTPTWLNPSRRLVANVATVGKVTLVADVSETRDAGEL